MANMEVLENFVATLKALFVFEVIGEYSRHLMITEIIMSWYQQLTPDVPNSKAPTSLTWIKDLDMTNDEKINDAIRCI